MKTILTLISILIIAYSLNAQELKGVYLGSYTKISQTNPRIVSLVYEDYILSTFNTKAGKVAIITAIPYERDTRGIRLIKFKEVSDLIDAFQAKYKVKFEFYPDKEGEENIGIMMGIAETYSVFIRVFDYDSYTIDTLQQKTFN
jgi:hypothetical protein